MAEILRMIALSPTMSEGKISKWKIDEGKSFSSGDVLCEVETDKASMDYEAPKSAVLLKIVLGAGKTAKVGDPVAVIGAAGEDFAPLLAGMAPEAAPSSAPASAPAKEEPAAPVDTPALAATSPPKPAAPSGGPSAPAGIPPSSPLARKRALEQGIDIRSVRGSGPNGRVVEKDVLEFAAHPSAAASAQVTSPARARSASANQDVYLRSVARAEPELAEPGMKRQVIARRLSESFFTAPHYYLKKKISAAPLLALRAQANDGQPSKLSFNAFLMKIAASSIARHPEVNVYWHASGADRAPVLEKRANIDIGLAVALPDGLITPVVRDCDAKSVRQIDAELAALVEKARAGKLSPEEYEGAGFTISNLGSFGIDEFTAIINPPGSAILAVGAVLREPVVNADGGLAVGHTMALTLGCDHRSVDGAVGAAFLANLANLLENPGMALV